MIYYYIVLRRRGGDVYEFAGIPARRWWQAARTALQTINARPRDVVFCKISH